LVARLRHLAEAPVDHCHCCCIEGLTEIIFPKSDPLVTLDQKSQPFHCGPTVNAAESRLSPENPKEKRKLSNRRGEDIFCLDFINILVLYFDLFCLHY